MKWQSLDAFLRVLTNSWFDDNCNLNLLSLLFTLKPSFECSEWILRNQTPRQNVFLHWIRMDYVLVLVVCLAIYQVPIDIANADSVNARSFVCQSVWWKVCTLLLCGFYSSFGVDKKRFQIFQKPVRSKKCSYLETLATRAFGLCVPRLI